MNNPSPLIALCAGEASGDLLGAHLIRAIRERCPEARFTGIGGPRMAAEGFESLFDQEKLAVRGYAEVLKKLPEILRIRRGLAEELKQRRPDVFVGIDAPDFNLWVAEQLKAAGIATVHYVSPSVWAWKRGRVKKIVRQVNEVLCLFPMEPPLYREAGGRARFVGHPLAQSLPLEADKTAARERLKLAQDIPVFALLPGSRVSEIDYMAPLFFRAAALMLRDLPEARFLLPYPTAADAVLVASGTATLEVALCKRPMVISYRISPLTYALVRHRIKVPHVGLPNILLGREAVPELLQRRAKPELLAAAMLDWYRQPEKSAELAQAFTELHQLLRRDSGRIAAEAVLAEAGCPVADPLPADDGSGSGQETAAAAPSDTGATT